MAATATMQIDPLALSRSESITTPVTSKATLPGAASSSKPTAKLPSSIPRIDFEPTYTDLKAAIGIQWTTYQDALTRFVQGGLNHHEFDEITEPIFSSPDASVAARIESLHNQLICALLSNTGRDMPDPGVAAFVSANDKPTAVTKPVSGDAAEQRTKTEVKNIPARDRRRIKAAGAAENVEGLAPGQAKPNVIDIAELQTTRGMRLKRSYEEYAKEKNIRLPDVTPASAGGLTKTNWDLEIRKRYTQPLFTETHDLPSESNAVLARVTPICYEESLTNGTTATVADFISIATESFVKEFLATVFARTRSNAPGALGPGSGAMISGFSAGAGGTNGRVVATARYRHQLEREEDQWKKGEIQRSRETGLLPIEGKEQAGRRPITMNDFKLAMTIGKGFVGNVPLICQTIHDSWQDNELEDWKTERREYTEWLSRRKKEEATAATAIFDFENNIDSHPQANGDDPPPLTSSPDPTTSDPMDIDTTTATTPTIPAKPLNRIPNGKGIAHADAGGVDGEVEEIDYGGWDGANFSDRETLNDVLGDILAMK